MNYWEPNLTVGVLLKQSQRLTAESGRLCASVGEEGGNKVAGLHRDKCQSLRRDQLGHGDLIF